MSDTVSNLLTCLRNAVSLRKQTVIARATSQGVSLIAALQRSGFIWGYSVESISGKSRITVSLKYTPDGAPVMRSLSRVSKPGNRVFVGADSIPPVQQRLGISIISTNRGLLSSVEAAALRVGGELICNVF